MGFALLAFSSFSQPLNALARWLRAPACRPPRQDRRAVAGQPGGGASGRGTVHAVTPGLHADAIGPSATRPAAIEPLPCTALEIAAAEGLPCPPALAPLPRRFVVVRPRQAPPDQPFSACPPTLAVTPSVRSWPSTSANDSGAFAGCSRPRPAARPLRVLDRRGPGAAARVLISGRMADVCAELDRLVRAEAALQAPH